MSNSTKIKLKRTQEQLNAIQREPISFGEPLFIDNNTISWGDITKKCNSYIAIGSPVDGGDISKAALFKGFWDISKASSLVFFKEGRKGLVDEENNPVYADKVVVEDEIPSDPSKKYFILCQPDVTESDVDHGSIKRFNMGDVGIYISDSGVMHGAAWNDYAETRQIEKNVEPGDVVCESGNGKLELSSCKLQACSYVVSDTYGVVIGEDKDIPVAIAGRVLVKIENKQVSVGDCVCAGKNGKAVVMTRREIKKFPDRILGVVTEIPSYEFWNGIKVNNRVWIKIR